MQKIKKLPRNKTLPFFSVPSIVISRREIFPSFGKVFCVTMEFDSGDAYEFSVAKNVYDSLCGRDTGKVSFQGLQWISFEKSENILGENIVRAKID